MKNSEECDTRYLAGVACTYANMLEEKFGGDAEQWYDKAKEFVNQRLEWHEQNRWDFQVHPDFEFLK